MSFAASLNKMCERAKDKAHVVVRTTAFELQGMMIDMSPVGNPELWAANAHAMYARETHNLWVDAINADLQGKKGRLRKLSEKKLKEKYKLAVGAGYVGGRFRGNWQVGLGALNASADAAPDKSGEATKDRAQAALQGWKPGQTIYLSNSVPYARRLEMGWSKQAPSGIVRLTVQRYGDALAEAVKGLK